MSQAHTEQPTANSQSHKRAPLTLSLSSHYAGELLGRVRRAYDHYLAAMVGRIREMEGTGREREIQRLEGMPAQAWHTSQAKQRTAQAWHTQAASTPKAQLSQHN